MYIDVMYNIMHATMNTALSETTYKHVHFNMYVRTCFVVGV